MKVLLPVSETVDKERIIRAFDTISVRKGATVVVFHVIELPSRASPLESSPYKEDIVNAENRLRDIANWLKSQNFEAKVKVVVARDAVHGIVDEAELGDYTFVLMLKRGATRGLLKFFRRSVSEAVIGQARCMVLIAPPRY